MGRRLGLVLLLFLLTGPALAAEAPDQTDGPRLRRWHLGLQAVDTWRSGFDVFGQPVTLPGTVAEDGRGAGGFLGVRFGDRFLLDLQMAVATHEISGSTQDVTDVEALITGTVLFRQRDTLQPFLRGGIGAGGEFLTLADDPGHVFAFGTCALAGGGLQVRLSSRVSIDLEMVATFANFLEVHDESEGNLWPDDTWQVRISNWGWRSGAGLVFWF